MFGLILLATALILTIASAVTPRVPLWTAVLTVILALLLTPHLP